MMSRSRRVSADELRRLLGVKRTTFDVEVPEGLVEAVYKRRRNRMYRL